MPPDTIISQLFRWRYRLVLVTLLSVVVNYAIAWGCLVLLPVLGHQTQKADNNNNMLSMAQQKTPSDWPLMRSIIIESLGAEKVTHEPWDLPGNSNRLLSIEVMSGGWPYKSVYCVIRNGDSTLDLKRNLVGGPFVQEKLIIPSIHWTKSGLRYKDHAIPIVPIVPNFFANTMVYAMAAVCVLVCYDLARRHWLCWQGRCAICAYNKGKNSSLCPECGHREK